MKSTFFFHFVHFFLCGNIINEILLSMHKWHSTRSIWPDFLRLCALSRHETSTVGPGQRFLTFWYRYHGPSTICIFSIGKATKVKLLEKVTKIRQFTRQNKTFPLSFSDKVQFFFFQFLKRSLHLFDSILKNKISHISFFLITFCFQFLQCFFYLFSNSRTSKMNGSIAFKTSRSMWSESLWK